MRKRHHKGSRLSLLVLLALLLSITLSACLPVADSYATSYLDEYDLPEFDRSKLREVERVYMNYYVEALADPKDAAKATADIYFEKFHEKIDTGDRNAVTEALIKSYILSIGDKYSIYRSAEEYESYDTEMSGTFYGIGVLVTRSEDDVITVIDVYDDSGANDAGIRAGDVIVAVAGQNVSDVGYDKAVNLIRGEEHTTVAVSVMRAGVRIDFNVERRKVVEKSVTYSIDENKIGYIEITSFKDNTDELFFDAIDSLKEAGAIGIIYDLRGNPGGYLSSVILSLSYIAPDDAMIVSFSNGYGRPKKDTHSHELSLPSVVICDGNTASAGELFTAAMRDFESEYGHHDVTIVGERTYGKGIMQTTVTLSDKSTVTLTVAYYNPPSGKNYHGEGITPDRTVELGTDSDTQLEAAYEEIFKLIK